MADGSGEEERKRKWRKKRYGRRKLLPGEDVEVLCCDEGLKGSWHAGTVIGCGGCSRLIEYRDLLNEDECSKLKETIPVSAAIEGQARRNPKNYRGLIRPLPPCYDVQIFEMRYGLCVDALVDDAWWEGVVFDHEEGSTNRMIFFPDQGDKQMVPVDHLRLTQDWNETSGRWKPRGKWLLLQVLQAFEKEDALPVSIREFWYDLSTMASFTEKIGHWMFGSQSGWESLASGLIRELLSVVHGLSVVSYVQSVDVPVTFGNDIPMDDVPHWKGSHIPNDTADDCFVEGSGSSSKSIHAKKSCSLEASGVEVYGKKTLISTTQDVQNQNSGIPLTYVTLEEVSTQDLHTKRRHRNIHQKANSHVQTVGQELKKSYFESINEVSPDRKHCRNLIKALEACNDIEFQSMKSDGTNNNLHCDGLFNEATNIFSHGNNTVEDARTRRSRTSWQSLYVDAELCPEAIALYAFRSADSNSQLKPMEIAEKVKKHLFALGWKIECRRDRFLRVRCLSPEGKHYYTLRNACIDLLKGRLNDDQSYRKGCNSIGNCSTFSKFDSNTANIYPEPAFLMQNLPVCSSIKRTEGTSDRFSHPFGLFETNIDTRTKKIPEEECRSFCKLADDSHDLLDSGITKLSVAEFHEGEQQSNTSVPGKENAKLNVSEDFPTFKNIEPEYLPEAIITYKRYIESSREKGNEKLPKLDIELMKLNAQKHLLYMGWRFAERRRKLRFASPGGEVFHSLYTACEAYLDKEENQRKTNESSLRGTNGSQNSWCLSTDDKFKYFNETSLLHTNNSFSTSMASDEFQESDEISNDGAENRAIIISYSSECGEGFSNLHLRNFTSSKIGIRNSSLLPMKATECRMLKHHSGCSQKSKKRKVQDPSSKGDEPSNIFLLPEQKLSERCQQIAVTSPTQKFTKATLSILIDNHIVSARQKVRYICKRNGHVMMEGHITRNGIKCKCCRKLHSLTGFEAHAGSNKCDPGANTFLLDGRSLLQCQLQMVYGKNPMNFPHPRLKHVYAHSQSDSICSVCQYGGTLILCDHCPSAFHVHCVGLKDVPKGKWFCPSCQCGICGSSAFNSAEEFTEKTMLYCHQCECKYHVGCLRERGMSFKCFPTGNWFCSKNCSKIFLHLRNLLGKSNPTTTEGLSWTIVRSMRETDADFKKLDFKTVPRHCSKLHVAHKLLHECFVTMIEPRTQSDLLADLLMNRESELNRLNFWGFYTMLLERGDKIISVATFRVYGEKIAEVPLVGTRAKYRRQGMCHIILDELEKLLSALGVERLCIPAVPTLIETWTSSFGFTKMSSYERLNLLEYTLLNFQGTIMCQKLLRAAPEVTNNPKGKYEQLTDSCSKNLEIIDSEASGLVSEVAEVVKILNSSPSLGIQACYFPGQIDTSKKISHQTHHSHSPASSSCKDPFLHTTKCDIIE